MTRSIRELMEVPADEHGAEWLNDALQTAIELEFSTIPPYLCAWWSIRSSADPVARSIRTIWREEMLHMGLACNLLVAIGGTPRLNVAESLPTYPGPLPGGVRPELVVTLAGLTRATVKTFMSIEYPEGGPIALRDAGFPTIGAFYGAVRDAFTKLPPREFDVRRQIEGPLGLTRIESLQQVTDAIDLIKHQGEGSNDTPEDTGPADLAHYYRFAEIDAGKKFEKDPVTGKWGFRGADVRFPDARPMGEVPARGYVELDVSPEVAALLTEFDMTFTAMLDQLQAAWENGDEASLEGAIDAMRALRGPAVALMDLPIPGTVVTYGPCFRLRR